MRGICIAVFLFCLSVITFAQNNGAIAAKFVDFSFQNDSLQTRARLFIPENSLENVLYPVVITLHGLGDCGDDNYRHISHRLATSWGLDDFQEKHPCYIFSPQCPEGSNWQSTKVYQGVMYLLDSLLNHYPIDRERIYLTGVSLGGMGTWNYLVYNPELYAAAVPVCGALFTNGGLLKKQVESFRHVPIWNCHGSDDEVVRTDESRKIFNTYLEFSEYPLFTHHFYRDQFNLGEELINEYIADHCELIYSEIPNVGHNAYSYAYYTRQIKEWLFHQRRHSVDNVIVDRIDTIVRISGEHQFDFSTSDRTDSISVWLGHINSPHYEYIGGIDADAGGFLFDSEVIADHPRARLKFLAHDTAGHVIGDDYSDFLCIDNAENGAPYISLVDDLFTKTDHMNLPGYRMKVMLADPESKPVRLSFFISYDNGKNFEYYHDRIAEEGLIHQSIYFSELSYSDSMRIKVKASDRSNTVELVTNHFENRAGINLSSESLQGDDLTIFPNPAQGWIRIETPTGTPSRIRISSMEGRVVYNEIHQGPLHELDISFLNSGVYNLSLYSGDLVITRKFFVSKY